MVSISSCLSTPKNTFQTQIFFTKRGESQMYPSWEFQGSFNGIRHTDFCMQILVCESTFFTLFNSEVAFYYTFFPLLVKKWKYFSSIFSSTTHMWLSAVATLNMWNETDLSLPYPYTDKLAPSNWQFYRHLQEHKRKCK